MAQRKTLTENQVAVLHWIQRGCPESVMSEHARISAAALRRRGLVTVAGRGSSWTAEITDEGQAYLDAALGPNPPIPRQPNLSVTEQLVRDVVAAGGALRVPRKSPYQREGVDYKRRAALAQEQGKVPPGKHLTVAVVSAAELEIRLVDDPAPLTPVVVPQSVARYHPAVRRFRQMRDRHEVSRTALPRVSRILQGLVIEAERRGHAVQVVSNDKSGRRQEGWSGPKHGHIEISADEHSSAIRISEEGLPSRVRWEHDNRRFTHFPDGEMSTCLPPISEYEEGASGRLVFELVSGFSGRRSKWADRRSWTVEEKLPELLREVELRAIESRERERQAAIAAAARQSEWERGIEHATARYLEDRRAEIFRAEATAWREARLLRDYCDAPGARWHPGGQEVG